MYTANTKYSPRTAFKKTMIFFLPYRLFDIYFDKMCMHVKPKFIIRLYMHNSLGSKGLHVSEKVPVNIFNEHH